MVKNKRVSFNPNTRTYIMWVWLYAAKKARSNYWEQCAVDRARFQRRIKEVGLKISWVLSNEHRSKINKNEQVRCQLDGGKTPVHRKRKTTSELVGD
uniref:Protein DP71L n=1 Tax=Erinnyis ello granulovirus TaxID=307444 RepID=A0A288WJ04_9BBAC|nr:protein phosphatase 1 [Erinnyis ello granulovirus]